MFVIPGILISLPHTLSAMQCPYVWDDPGDPLEPRFQVYKSGTCVPLYCRTYLHEYCCHLYTSLTMKERYSVNVPVESEDSFQLYDLRVEVVCPPGKRIISRILHIFTRCRPPAARGETARHISKRLDVHGRRGGVSRPELPQQAAHYSDGRADV